MQSMKLHTFIYVFIVLLSNLSLSGQHDNCPTNIKMYLRFDEGQGTTTFDELGNHNITFHNPTWADGCSGTALEFNGADQYLDVPDHSDFDWSSDNSFSVELWANFNYVYGENKVMVGRDETHTGLHWWIGAESETGYPNSTIRDNDSTMINLRGSKAIDDDKWHYIVLQYNSVNHTVNIYVDGQKDGEKSFYPTGNFRGTSDLNIGYMSYNDSSRYFYRGMLDEVAVYNRSLSEDEIEKHFELGLLELGYCDTLPDVTPQFTSEPPTQIQSGCTYNYIVQASGNPTPVYSLITSPINMSINDTTGLIQWIPTDTGSFDVTVEAANRAGSVNQVFTIEVFDTLQTIPDTVEVPSDTIEIPDSTDITGIKHDLKLKDILLNLYPNPVANTLYWSVDCTKPEKLYVELTDVVGKRVYQEICNNYKSGQILQIDMRQFKPGLYYLSVYNNNAKYTKPVFREQ